MTQIESKKKMKVTRIEPIDRLSDLPDSVLHHVLSFLDMKEVVQKSILSRRWRYLWKFIPVLNFVYPIWKIYRKKGKRNLSIHIESITHKNECLDFVDKVLNLRDSSSAILKIHFSYCYFSDITRFDGLFTFALKQPIKQVHLEISEGRSYMLPAALFNAEIEVFKLRTPLLRPHGVSVIFPKPVCSTQLPDSLCSAHQLTTLELVLAKLPEGNSEGELVFNYPVLENLIIEECDRQHIKILNINVPKLKNLVVANNKSSSSCETKLCTPNLLSVKFADTSYEKYVVGKLSSLVSATIGETCTLNVLRNKCLTSLLKGLHNVTTLELRGGYEDSPESTHMLNDLLRPFSNLRCLKLIGLSGSSCMEILANFLKSAPSVETLVLERYWGVDMGEQLTKLTSQYVFASLRCVKLVEYISDEDKLKFLGFILQTAVVLENIIVIFGKLNESKLHGFRKKLDSLPEAISSVKIDLLVKP